MYLGGIIVFIVCTSVSAPTDPLKHSNPKVDTRVP